MYAGTIVNYHEIVRTRTNASADETLPLFWSVFSSDKGTEEMGEYTADEFFDMFGKNADWFKYGQPLTQTHAILNAGGKVLAKRLVAPDATLANIAIYGEVTKKETQKADADGKPLYVDTDGSETTNDTGTPAMITSAQLKYTVQTVTNAKDYELVVAEVEKTESDTKFPLLVICDNGRGESVKRIRIAADYSLSKSLDYCMYSLIDMENTVNIESTRFSMNPDATYTYNSDTRSLNLIKTSTNQLQISMLTDSIKKFVTAISDISGYSEDAILASDFLFGNTKRGLPMDGIEVDETGVDLGHAYGVELLSGSNGSFGANPWVEGEATDPWKEEALKYLNGSVTDEIYDLELHKVDFFFDANYPMEVKTAIAELCSWRQDFYFFCDMGRKVWLYDDVAELKSSDSWHAPSPFVGDYMSTYEVIDQFSKKQVRVTMMHGMAPLMVTHYDSNISAPIAGMFNGFTITEAIPGTLNYSPRVTPRVNQKEQLDDLRVNFANYENNNATLVVQALHTSQSHDGPLMWASNTIVTQAAVKEVRRYMPKIRFMQVEGTDYTAIKKLIDDNALAKFKKFFSSIELVYVYDQERIDQRIFTAAINCHYKKFERGEIFDVYAIDGSASDDTSAYTSKVIDI